ncbi:hypothetical protein SUDANB176_00565 [Streptomyces sp. enrichment culture]
MTITQESGAAAGAGGFEDGTDPDRADRTGR